MDQSVKQDLDAVLAKEAWTTEDFCAVVRMLFDVPSAAGKLHQELAKLQGAATPPCGAEAMKVGILQYALCRFDAALKSFNEAPDNKDRRWFAAMCCKSLNRWGQAIEEFDRAKSRGWDADAADIQIIEMRALNGELEAADKAVKSIQKRLGETADWLYVRGLVDELNGYIEQAAELYEKARAVNPSHTAATFRLAYFHDLRGQEEQAIELYRECISRPPVHANALLNMAVLYEDFGQYDKAIAAVRTVLATNPNHLRARLFMKDIQAAETMFVDEDHIRRMQRRNAVLDIPVTDFELSVRARNCLKKMNIRSLGDLVRTTESELLSYKNFGETSLKEIKDMLTAKGLRLGQALEDGSEFQDLMQPEPVGDQGVLATPIAQLNLSVRCNRTLEALRVKTLGDLTAKTEAELLACRNFGQTSLNEIRQRLTEFGVKLREVN